MLREGWDVQNVTVVVGLRPYTAAANILPEQAIGRGLHLMFRGQNYTERVDIIGNKNFLTLPYNGYDVSSKVMSRALRWKVVKYTSHWNATTRRLR